MSVDSGIVLDVTHAAAVDSRAVLPEVRRARERLEAGSGPGGELTGWLDLPARVAADELDAIDRAADRIREHDALVVCGIGGSFLGARAVIEALADRRADGVEVLFAGCNLDATYHASLLRRLAGKRYAVNVISKSGTTTAPLVALRLLLADLERRYPRAEVDRLVYATTGRSGGLAELAAERGWASFEVPVDVGGRFSVLTSVGLLPAAAAGCDVRALVAGAGEMMAIVRDPRNDEVPGNPALQYASLRQAAYRAGRKVEALLYCAPALRSLAEWWKQLFGESEGKDGKGMLPTSIGLTTDLHSLGQWLQDGEPIALETAIDVIAGDELAIPAAGAAADRLLPVAGRELHEVNRIALAATLEAHAAGGTPCSRIELPELTEPCLGALLYFFEYACAVSGYTLGVNPFDQPGVEGYKSNIRRLLGDG